MDTVLKVLFISALLATLLELLWKGMVKIVFPVVAVLLCIFVLWKSMSWVWRTVTFAFNPKAKEAYEQSVLQREAVKAVRRAEAQRASELRESERLAEEKAKLESELAFAAAKQEAQAEAERERIAHRDAEDQSTPYAYRLGTHANEALALRYGIANLEPKKHDYWYTGRGGEQLRNPARDYVTLEPSSSLRVRKIRRVLADQFEVLLVDFRDRRAIAVIEHGTEYIKTFLPQDHLWYDRNPHLESLKGSDTYSLKELALLHANRAVWK